MGSIVPPCQLCRFFIGPITLKCKLVLCFWCYISLWSHIVKGGIQALQSPIRLPCYDLTPVIDPTMIWAEETTNTKMGYPQLGMEHLPQRVISSWYQVWVKPIKGVMGWARIFVSWRVDVSQSRFQCKKCKFAFVKILKSLLDKKINFPEKASLEFGAALVLPIQDLLTLT